MQPQSFTAENYVDNHFVKCFSPIHAILMILGTSRMSIKKQLVTKPTLWQKIYTLFCIAAVTFSISYFVVYYYKIYYDKDITLFVACEFGMFVQHTSYLTSIINARFCDCEPAVKICIKLQNIDNLLTLKKELNSLKTMQYYLNIIVLLSVIMAFESGYAMFVVATIEYPILTVFAAVGLLNVYLELVLAGSTIFYLAIRLRFLNKVVKYNLSVKCKIRAGRTPMVVNERLMISSDLDNSDNLGLDKFLTCLKEILNSYKLITEVFSFPVFNITTTLFVWALLIIQAMIIGRRTELFSVLATVLMGLWLIFYIILLTMVALVSDYFIKEVRQTKLHCIHAMSCLLEGPIWKGANDVLRTIQQHNPTFSVYGIFILDRKLPLTLIGIITTNVVVLIQFTVIT